MSDPAWLAEARKYIGLTEFPGASHNQTIMRWLDQLSAWWRDDETPWCGVFVAHCMQATGQVVPKYWMRAKAWAEWGEELPSPVLGCVVVFERKGGGHVGFVVGRARSGNLMVLGGNQGNKVSIAEFARDRVVGYYWPPGVAMLPPAWRRLAEMDSAGQLSTNEA
jgi:uncharacterized protein (TIGR02594 family)